jgi:crotonobetainyl-CoA:carnitine CoA-transferase CaiB-like acyl-CoA transferase
MSGYDQLPMTGIRIVDLTHDWAGPHATRLLGDFGAEVIKVEYSRRIDSMRGANKENEAYNHHPRWHEINRNKLSITLDLRIADDLERFRELVRVSDIVVESSRVGVMERFGLGYETLREIKPDIIVVSMSPFGQTGPEAAYAGYGGCLEPLSGIQVLTGYDESSKPMRIREVDVTNGVLGACAIMTALIYRQQTGCGQWVDLSQFEAATSGLIGEHLLEYVMNGTQTLPLGNRHRFHAPQGCYRCEGDDKWVAIMIRSEDEWKTFCESMDRSELASDARFASRQDRMRSHDELDQIIEEWTLSRTHYEVMHQLQRAGIAAGAILNAAEIAIDPHLQERGFFQTLENGNHLAFPGMPFHFSECKSQIRRPGPDLGEHNAEVLCGILGISRDEIKPLTEDKIGTAFDI